MQTNAADDAVGKALSVLLWIAIVCFFAYLTYAVCSWLIFGAGTGVLIFALFGGVIVLLFGRLPEALSKRTGQTGWQAERSIQLYLLFSVGIFLGFYWMPKHFFLSIAWYWRVMLGIAIGVLGLVTRRFR